MKRRLCWVFGGLLLVVAVALPFAGLERFDGDTDPLILGLVGVAVGAGFWVLAWRPTVFEHYVRLVSLVFLTLALLGVIGLLSNIPEASLAGTGSPMYGLGLLRH